MKSLPTRQAYAGLCQQNTVPKADIGAGLRGHLLSQLNGKMEGSQPTHRIPAKYSCEKTSALRIFRTRAGYIFANSSPRLFALRMLEKRERRLELAARPVDPTVLEVKADFPRHCARRYIVRAAER
jgi:hypothetical protein